MPSLQVAGALLTPLFDDATPAGPTALPALQLAQASHALWLATLALMTAFMQNQAPAHRYLLARRISRNFDTLARQECFACGCRTSFERLARRWQGNAEQFAPEFPQPQQGLQGLFP